MRARAPCAWNGCPREVARELPCPALDGAAHGPLSVRFGDHGVERAPGRRSAHGAALCLTGAAFRADDRLVRRANRRRGGGVSHPRWCAGNIADARAASLGTPAHTGDVSISASVSGRASARTTRADSDRVSLRRLQHLPRAGRLLPALRRVCADHAPSRDGAVSAMSRRQRSAHGDCAAEHRPERPLSSMPRTGCHAVGGLHAELEAHGLAAAHADRARRGSAADSARAPDARELPRMPFRSFGGGGDQNVPPRARGLPPVPRGGEQWHRGIPAPVAKRGR